MLVRFADWRERLAEFLQARAQQRFAWGRQDCALLACDAVEAITGTDPALWLRGEYDSALGAARVMKRWLEERGVERLGAATLAGLLGEVASRLALVHGAPRCGIGEAGPGDVVLCRAVAPAGRDQVAITVGLGLIGLAGEVVSAGLEGLESAPMKCIGVRRAWRIG